MNQNFFFCSLCYSSYTCFIDEFFREKRYLKIDFWFHFRSFCRRLEYTREQLLEFKKQLDEKVHRGDQGGEFGGFGGFGGGATEVSTRFVYIGELRLRIATIAERFHDFLFATWWIS